MACRSEVFEGVVFDAPSIEDIEECAHRVCLRIALVTVMHSVTTKATGSIATPIVRGWTPFDRESAIPAIQVSNDRLLVVVGSRSQRPKVDFIQFHAAPLQTVFGDELMLHMPCNNVTTLFLQSCKPSRATMQDNQTDLDKWLFLRDAAIRFTSSSFGADRVDSLGSTVSYKVHESSSRRIQPCEDGSSYQL